MAQVLNFHDAVVYDTDVGLFGDGGWLNDSCINWFFRVLEHEVFPGRKELLFVDPAVVSCMMHQCDDEEELADLGRGLDLQSRSKIFVPVNNAEGRLSRGSHWSLLVLERETEQMGAAGNSNSSSSSSHARLRHFDSSMDSNRTPAERTAAKFLQMLGETAVGGDGSSWVEHVRDAPQQINDFDCGMYTILLTRRLASEAAVTPGKSAPPAVLEAKAAAAAATVVLAASGESIMPDQDREAVLEGGQRAGGGLGCGDCDGGVSVATGWGTLGEEAGPEAVAMSISPEFVSNERTLARERLLRCIGDQGR